MTVFPDIVTKNSIQYLICITILSLYQNNHLEYSLVYDDEIFDLLVQKSEDLIRIFFVENNMLETPNLRDTAQSHWGKVKDILHEEVP